ncbi:MAG TPA: tRNA adenosine(34) deaminase TadA [Humisphaera sp.]|nr:tRNA adenosine(34) deaminase TadA [Humisphaera sp.]
MSTSESEHWMTEAIAEARKAEAIDEVPIGCVIVHDPSQTVIGRGYNRRQIDRDATAHAEILAIRQAGHARGGWRLIDCSLYVTLEPCPMCAGAIVNARIPRLAYGCDDPKAGAVRTLFQLCEDPRLNHRVIVEAGILADQCGQLLRVFFQKQRAMGKK